MVDATLPSDGVLKRRGLSLRWRRLGEVRGRIASWVRHVSGMKGAENYMIGARLAIHILYFLLLLLFVGFGPSSRADRDLHRLDISATRMRGELRCANLEQPRMLRLPTSRLDGDISVESGVWGMRMSDHCASAGAPS